MIKFYKKAIDKGCMLAILKLCKYYSNIQNYDQMINYLLIGVQHKDSYCIYNLAQYYQAINDHNHMIVSFY